MVPTRTKFAVGKEQSSNKLKLRVSEQFSKSADCDARLPFHALKTILLFLGNPICHTGIDSKKIDWLSLVYLYKRLFQFNIEYKKMQEIFKKISFVVTLYEFNWWFNNKNKNNKFKS